MINQIIRYLPVIDFIQRHNPKGVCELGSGSYGIGKFLNIPFTGCDKNFEDYSGVRQFATAKNPIEPVRCDATALPFDDKTFDLVFCLDIFEHLSPQDRLRSFTEMYRVSRKYLIIGFPQGDAARKVDERLYRICRRVGKSIPGWLKEHVAIQYPQEEFQEYLQQQQCTYVVKKNENAMFHLLLLLFEMMPVCGPLSSAIAERLPLRVNQTLWGGWVHRGTPYRKIYFIQKDGV